MTVLPLSVIQHLAAGEVIHDYATALHELVENALDASATSILVHFDPSTHTLTVTDDGIGLPTSADLHLAATPNATSKLHSLRAMHAGVSTLGFRGQALPALATLATSLTLSTRPRIAPHGTTAQFSAPGPPHTPIAPVAMAPGTVVQVRGLPFTIQSGDRRRLIRALSDIALCHPHVTFHLRESSRLLLACPTTVIERRLARLTRLPTTSVKTNIRQTDFGSVTVALALPMLAHSSSRESLRVAVNGRVVKCDAVTKTLTKLVTVPRRRFPIAFVHVHTTNPAAVDWNVAPTKTVMRFRPEKLEHAIVQEVVESVTSILQRGATADLVSGIGEEETEEKEGKEERIDTSENSGSSVKSLFSLLAKPSHAKNSDQDDSSMAFGDDLVPLSKARVVAQVLQTYILLEHDGGIVLVEQHVADERAIFERIRTSWDSRWTQLEKPLRLPQLTSDAHFTLTSLGFEIEDEDEGKNIIRRVPRGLMEVTSTELVSLILKMGCRQDDVDETVAGIACRLAVRNGTVLTHRRMERIVRELFRCRNAHTCPHGRPVFRKMGVKELAVLFGRSWIPERVGPGRHFGMLPEE